MSKKLTAKFVENLKPGTKRKEIPDGGSGLFYVLQPTGRSVWASRFRFAGHTRKLTHGVLTLAAARKAHADAMLEVAQGRDPAAAKIATRTTAKTTTGDTIGRLFELFVIDARRKVRPATWQQCESIFRREVLPRWRGRLATDITRKDVPRACSHYRPDQAGRGQSYTVVSVAVLQMAVERGLRRRLPGGRNRAAGERDRS